MFDPVDVRVARILRLAAERAYDFPRPHDEGPACETCKGDGCQQCRFTGDPS